MRLNRRGRGKMRSRLGKGRLSGGYEFATGVSVGFTPETLRVHDDDDTEYRKNGCAIVARRLTLSGRPSISNDRSETGFEL